ncbi:S8 family serine peptidase [Aliiglaciecola sp. CAU 1673]|uniref:S8 family peptidase n=1 Tax=Aliiglaciecola sp. CAU 1673 TaxID=3032595 RepID=UPI0023DCE552|nr:S8 family serine peptidase [Aliiglaciecola sp. CAU 1673]MDF2177549.1 S8 family serine peptidase [Aliiglaciecola sp. CAU 1673]
MRHQLSTLISALLVSASAVSAQSFAETLQVNKGFKQGTDAELKAVSPASIKQKASQDGKKSKFFKEADLDHGYYDYIVRLKGEPVSTYRGDLASYPATHAAFTSKRSVSTHAPVKYKLDAKSPEARQYAQFLKNKQSDFITRAQNAVAGAKHVTSFQYALNAVVMRMTQTQAEKLSRLSDVAFVERSKIEKLHTDAGPKWIGSEAVWNGTATGTAYKGEGVIVGIIDTGINTDHPSFADVGADGYDHTNPFGAGVYKGDCETDASLCNDKLIGVYSFPEITGEYENYAPGTPQNGEDHNGHGSHVASTAAGNVLLDVPLLDANGTPNPDFSFPSMSGVAPHANVISYQVCRPGEQDAIGFSGCPTTLVLAAVEQAIVDGVDVLNHSIGAANLSPWEGSKGQAFLSAREAGIVVANSAGNDGPDPETASSNAAAPWVLTVAAYSHDRSSTPKELKDFSGGDTEAPEAITGLAQTGGITASIVYAGDYPNANDPEGDPAQCLQPFPEGTFSGEIVICDRGTIARVDKGKNVDAGGAGGLVLANIQGGSNTVAADNHVLPAIHIDADSGDALKAWVASGTGHMATITASYITNDPALGNIAAGFTSRGPNNSLEDVITPSIAAPGLAIWAAYADDQPEGFKEIPDPSDFAFLQGTSMASPHIAGAAALLKGARPSWTPAEIQSALMLTANQNTLKDDGVTPSDFFDMGSGMANVGAAASIGLLMDISIDEYLAADPAEGGDPKALNLPSMANARCVGACSWTRTVKATKDGSWSVSSETMSSGLDVTFSPASFTLTAGQEQQIEVHVDASLAESDVWAFGNLVLAGDAETLRMPIAVKPTNGNLPSKVELEAHRDADSYLLTGLQALEITNLTVRSYGLVKATQEDATVVQDSDNGDVFDDVEDGVKSYLLEVPEGAKRLVVETIFSESPDLDLWVGLDENGDGVAQETELVAFSATGSALEKVDLLNPAAGNYWVLVQNWQASAEDAEDAFTLAHTVIDGNLNNNLTVTGPSAVTALEEFELRLGWNLAMEPGDLVYGAVDLGSSAELAGNLGLLSVDLIRGEDDVRLSSDADTTQRLVAGDQVTFTVDLAGNYTAEDRNYLLEVNLPAGVSLVADSVSPEGELVGNTLSWEILQPSLLGVEPSYNMTTNASDAQCVAPFTGNEYLDLAAFGITPGSANGDSTTATYNVGAYFLGNLYSSVTLTDDGFVLLGNTNVGSEPWTNQLMPDATAPNGLVAPFWRDMVFDVDNGSTLSVATAGSKWTILEYDDMMSYYADQGVNDVLDFEVIFNNSPAEGEPNIIFAYDNVTHHIGDGLPVSIGYESGSGNTGATYYHVSPVEGVPSVGSIEADIVDNRMICLYLQAVEGDKQLTFTVQIDEDNAGGPLGIQVLSSLPDTPGTKATSAAVATEIQVEGPPVISTNAPTQMMELSTYVLSVNAQDPNGDALTYEVSVDSNLVQISGSAPNYTLAASGVSADTPVTLTVSVSDGKATTTQTATIVVLNEKSRSSGSLGWVSLLLLPLLWVRRRKAS